MGRAKLRMELISNKKARVKAFEKRKRGLEKAANELSILCGVDIGMIIYGPAQDKESEGPMVWPRNHQRVASLIDSYKSRSGYDCRYRAYNLPAFFKDRTEKIEEEVERLRKRMREAKYPKWDEMYDSLSDDQLKEFAGLLIAKIDAVRGRINLMKGSRVLLMESGFLMNPTVQGSAVFMPSARSFEQPDIVQQQQQHWAYNDAQVNMADQGMMMAMMMNNGASCSQGTCGFDENCSNYAYSSDGNWVQNCGLGTGVMENVGANNDGPLMPYCVPDVMLMPQNEQCLLLSGAFLNCRLTWE